MEIVSIIKASNNQTEEAVLKNIELLGGIKKYMPPGGTVLIKPSLTFNKDWTSGATANPAVVTAIAKLCWEAGAKRVVIGEITSNSMEPGDIFKQPGYREAAEKAGAELVDLNKDPVNVYIQKSKVLKKASITRLALECDFFINVPMLKTNVYSVVSFSLKNMEGIYSPSTRREMHNIGLDQAIADLNLAVKQDLIIVDGIIGQEGLGPARGTPVKMDLIIGGTNPVAVDSICSRLIGIEPERVAHLVAASELGLGPISTASIQIIGEPVEKVKRYFKRAPERLDRAYEGINIISAANDCAGCMRVLIDSLGIMDETGKLDQIKERHSKVNFVTGLGAEPPKGKSTNEPWFFVGKCQQKHKTPGRHIPGCPPHGSLIIDVVRETAGLEPFPTSEILS